MIKVLYIIFLIVERCYDFIYKQRLLLLIKNKNLFLKNNKNMFNQFMQNKNKTKQCHMITKDDINDEFDFENYLRIAFTDWNLITISQIIRSTNHRRCTETWFRKTKQMLDKDKNRTQYDLKTILG